METASPEPQPAGPHIFLIQQDPAEAENLEKLLTDKGCRVTVTLNGNSAYSQLPNLMPDIIISDIIVPDLDGPSLTIRLKNEERFQGIQVILLTRASQLGDLLEVLTCGADAFLPKPVDPGYVSTLIEYLMGNRAVPQKPEPVQTQFRVAYDGNEYSLLTGRRKLLDFLLSAYEIMGIRVGAAADLEREVASLTRKITDLEQEHAQKTEDAVAILNQDILGLKNTTEKLQESVADRDHQIEALRSQLRIFEHQVKAKTGEAGDLQSALAAAAEEKKTLEERILALQNEAEEKERELTGTRSDLEAAKSSLQEETAKVQESEQNLAKALAGFADEKKELEERMLALRNEADGKETDFQNRIDELVYELSDTRSDYEAAQKRLREETQKSEKLESDLKEARDALTGSEQALQEKERISVSEKQDAARQVQELEEIIATQEEDLKESQGAAAAAAGALKEAEQKHTEGAEEADRKIRELSDTIREKDDEIRSIVSQNEEAAARAKQEAADAEAALRKRWEEAESASAEQIRTLRAENARLSEEMQGRNMAEEIARAALADRDKRESALRQQVKELETNLSGKEQILAGNIAGLEAARKESAALGEQVKTLTGELEDKARALSALEKSLADEREVRSSAETRAFSVAQEKEDAEARAGSLAHEFERMAGRVADLEGVIGARDEEIRTLAREIEALRNTPHTEQQSAGRESPVQAGSIPVPEPAVPEPEPQEAREVVEEQQPVPAVQVPVADTIVPQEEQVDQSPAPESPVPEAAPEMPGQVPAEDIPVQEPPASVEGGETVPVSPGNPEIRDTENTPITGAPDIATGPAAAVLSQDAVPELRTERVAKTVTEVLLKPDPVESRMPAVVERSVPAVILPRPVPDIPRVEINIVKEPEIVREPVPAPDDGPTGPDKDRWSAIVDWAHRNGKLSPQERGHLVIMGRLARKGKEPTADQAAFANEILERAKSAGYRPEP